MANSRAFISIYDEPMWESIRAHRMALQCCSACGSFRYPPGPICPDCLSLDYEWKPLSGEAEILSWVVFHRQYFDNYPPPYNVITVQLKEGPIMVSNLSGAEPEGTWIGKPVGLVYEQDAAIGTLPRFRLAT